MVQVMFVPDKESEHPDLMATTSDLLRLWRVGEDSTQLIKELTNVPPPPLPPAVRFPLECCPQRTGLHYRQRLRKPLRSPLPRNLTSHPGMVDSNCRLWCRINHKW